MKRALLAWELGGGYGHVAKLRPLAEAFAEAGWRVAAAAKDPAPIRAAGFAALPAPQPAPAPPAPALNLSAILLGYGYASEAALAPLVAAWRRLFAETRADLVCADYAPTALLAARLAGLPAIAIGMGFYLPPLAAPLPSLQPWREVAESDLAAPEATALAAVNGVRARHGAPPLARFADLWAAEARFLCTWPELDHYGPRAEGGYCGPITPGGPAPAPQSPPRAFVYLRADERRLPALLRAFAAAGVQAVGHLRGASAAQLQELAAPGVALSLARRDALAELAASHFVVCHGGHGLASQALRAGRPLLLLPSQAEQTAISFRLARQGLGLVVDPRRPDPDFAIPLRKLAAGACLAAAQAFAARYAGHDPAALARRVVAAADRLTVQSRDGAVDAASGS